MEIDLITAFPDFVEAGLSYSIVERAREADRVEARVHDLRRWADEDQRQIDDYPYGGGGGMVLKPEPIFRAIEELTEQFGPYDERIYMSPDGEPLTQSVANELSLRRRLLILSGHYKGVDQRVRDALITREVTIGDYVLSGGELPALVLVDAVVRLIPGVLGDSGSALSDSFQDGLLDAPVYTRPAEFREMEVPVVLRSGDHERIDEWREEQRWKKTKSRRPDLLDRADADSTSPDET